MRNHYERIVRDAEKRARQSLRRQVKQPGKSYGAFENENGVTEAKYAVYRATSALSVYCCRDSCFYHDPEIFAMIRDGLRYAASRQHESGLFDLVGCNFESAPDTAFILKRIYPFLMYLDAHRATKEEEEVFQLLREIAVKGANGVIHGGFHTPNHRWAIASCLLLYGRLSAGRHRLHGRWRVFRKILRQLQPHQQRRHDRHRPCEAGPAVF